MNRTQLNRALTGIDDRYLTMVDRKTEEVQTMRQKNIRAKKLFRTILIAAAIMALMGLPPMPSAASTPPASRRSVQICRFRKTASAAIRNMPRAAPTQMRPRVRRQRSGRPNRRSS